MKKNLPFRNPRVSGRLATTDLRSAAWPRDPEPRPRPRTGGDCSGGPSPHAGSGEGCRNAAVAVFPKSKLRSRARPESSEIGAEPPQDQSVVMRWISGSDTCSTSSPTNEPCRPSGGCTSAKPTIVHKRSAAAKTWPRTELDRKAGKRGRLGSLDKFLRLRRDLAFSGYHAFVRAISMLPSTGNEVPGDTRRPHAVRGITATGSASAGSGWSRFGGVFRQIRDHGDARDPERPNRSRLGASHTRGRHRTHRRSRVSARGGGTDTPRRH